MNNSSPVPGNIKSLRAVVRYLAPYRTQIAGAALALIFTSGAVLGLGLALRYLVDEGVGKGDVHLLNRGYEFLMGVILLWAFATYARYYLVSWIGERTIADLRNDIYRQLMRMDIAFYETTRTGEMLSRLTTDTTLLQTVIGGSVSQALRNMLMMIGGLTMLLITSAKLTGYVLLILPVVLIPILVLGKRVRGLSRATQDRVADLSALAEESLNAIRSVQALSLEQHEGARFSDRVQVALDTALRRIGNRAMLVAIVIALVLGAIVTVLWIGGKMVVEGNLSAGELSSFVFYSVVVAGTVGSISEIIGELQRAGGGVERIMELLALRPAIAAPTHPQTIPAKLSGNVAFEQVTFFYPSRPEKPALADIALTVKAGETVALVGPSGAGKTTLFQLLLRFYDPSQGRITLDNIPIHEAAPEDLRRHIGLVPQDPFIFSADAWENIRYGNTQATQEEILKAAHDAAALEFLERLPQGLGTFLGEKGVRLSGGQRQRIAIARAIIRNPEILLLDEATSALDAENELLVQQALERVMQGRTTLVIAHRLATVLKADRIVVLDEGRIQAIGSHQELLQTSPLYARLARLQFGE